MECDVREALDRGPIGSHTPRLGYRMQGERAELYLYDEFDEFFGITARDVREALDMLSDGPELAVHISSPGGSTDIGVAIMSAISHAAPRFDRVTAIVDGAAYSAATLPALPANETVMMPGALWYIHRPMTMIAGHAEELVDAAGVLERLQLSVAELYARRTGASQEAMLEAMVGPTGNGTYYTAEDTVEAGFADRVAPTITERETAPTMFFSRRGFVDRPGAPPQVLRAEMRTHPYRNHFLHLPRDADPRQQSHARARLGRITQRLL